MRITSNLKANNAIFNNISVNKNTQTKQKTNKPYLNKRTSFTKSQVGRLNDMIESLIEQKQKITDSKNNLISNTLEEGKDIDSIKEQVKLYDEQLKELKEQITELRFQKKQIKHMNFKKNKKTVTNTKTDKATKLKKGKNIDLNNVVDLQTSFVKNKDLMVLKRKYTGKQRVLLSHQKQNERRGVNSKSLQKELNDIKDSISYLNNSLKSNMKNISEKLTNKNKKDQQKEESVQI